MSGGNAKPKRTPVVCHGHTRPVVDVNFSQITPDGYFLASASKDSNPMLRHGETGDWYGTFMGHKGAVWSCSLNQPALLCATGSADFTARVWDACTGNQLHELPHGHIVRTTAFSHASNKLATGGFEKVIRVFDLEDPSSPTTFPAMEDGIRSLVWLQDDTTLLAAYNGKPGIAVVDARSGQVVRTLDTEQPVTSIEMSFDAQHVTTAEGSTVRVWDTASLSPLATLRTKPGNAQSASYCASRGLVAVGGGDMWVRVYNVASGAEVECNKGHHGPVHAVRFAPSYDCYATGSEDGTIRIWYLDEDSEPPASAVTPSPHTNGNGVTAAVAVA